MQLSNKHISSLARAVNVSERAIERLLGSVTADLAREVHVQDIDDLSSIDLKKIEQFQLGLRLFVDQELPLIWSSATETLVQNSLQEYRTLCPVVFNWVCSGNFNSKNPPESATRGSVLHASRTASRLRAKVLRSIRRGI